MSADRDRTDPASRNLFVELALSYFPHLVQLVDRNPFSPTYGCFDREYWHYRTSDFPCGMHQEMCLPLAMLYTTPYPGNRYHGWERLRELAVAGIEFSMKSSHPDGSCDDYFPYEQAMGALVFSTYACTETFLILGLDDERMRAFFRKRGDYLARHNEAGRLSNHQAFAALAAYNIYLVTGDEKYRRLAEDRIELTLSWQHAEEGWFQEYEGADPGYHTATVDFLAKVMQKGGYDSLVDPLRRAVDFAWHFVHPDGSYGGEYGSRNTYHFYPHGFEIMARHTEKAAQINDAYLKGARSGKRYHNEDDRMCCHSVYGWLQAYDDFWPQRPEPVNSRENFSAWMPGAGMAVVKTDSYYAVAALRKGGVTKVFNEDRCLGSDTGLIAELDDGRVIVTHLMDEENRITADTGENTYTVEGHFSYRRSKLSSPVKLIVFRCLNLALGRFFPDLLRSLLQKMLITGKPRTGYPFRRTIRFESDGVTVADELPLPIPLKRLAAGSDATSIYVANSNVFQESSLRIPWRYADTAGLRQAREGGLAWNRTVTIATPSSPGGTR